jgi:hypothetical protein
VSALVLWDSVLRSPDPNVKYHRGRTERAIVAREDDSLEEGRPFAVCGGGRGKALDDLESICAVEGDSSDGADPLRNRSVVDCPSLPTRGPRERCAGSAVTGRQPSGRFVRARRSHVWARFSGGYDGAETASKAWNPRPVLDRAVI